MVMSDQKIANYIFELGALKKFRHSGFKLAGINHPDSIAEHAFRAAIIAYFLAEKEKHPEPEKIAFQTLIHDNAEARISDLHKVAARYIDSHKGETKAFREQTDTLPKEIGEKFLKYFNDYELRKTTEGKIARDADLLETAFQAKEYFDLGYTDCIGWINNAESLLTTKSAKQLMKQVRKVRFTDWWQNLKKIK